MKKEILLLSFLFLIFGNLNAQDRNAMIGLSVSYEFFENREYYYDDKKSTGSIVGLEYAETKGRWGYSAGIFYSRTKDYINYYNPDIIFIDIYIPPQQYNHQVYDFPISGQMYFGKKKLKGFVSLGISTSLSIVNNFTDYYFRNLENERISNMSIRGIYGTGLSYRISKHIGIDMEINRRVKIYTIDDNQLMPLNSFGLETKVNYLF